MASKYFINTDENIILYHLDTDFNSRIASEMFRDIGSSLSKEITYNEFITFRSTADLAHISQQDFSEIITCMKRAYEFQGIKRQRTAILAARDSILRPMAILWVAHCELDNEILSTYRAFSALNNACNWIKLPISEARQFLNK